VHGLYPLLERLGSGVTHLFTVLLGASALTCVGTVGSHQLVDQIFVEFTTEHSLGSFHLGSGLALFIQEFELH
jgi:hypothetical protein